MPAPGGVICCRYVVYMQWGAAGGRGVYNLFAGNRKNILNKQQGFATQLASASRSQ
jgi:hypothetical protein